MMLGDDLLYRELAYEAMSRGRKENRIYMSRTMMTELDLRLEDGPHARTVETDDPIGILAAASNVDATSKLALGSIAVVPLDAWATGDLVAERNRIRAVLDDAPPDRTADIAALAKSRHQAEQQLDQQRRSIEQLECRKRPRKQRLPDVDLVTARHNLSYCEQQADRLGHAIAALHASQHRRASHLVAYRAQQVELEAIGDVLDERLCQQTNRVVLDPPTYITKPLGYRPRDRAKDRVWVRAVVEVGRYRLEHGVNDDRTTIGPEPVDLEPWRAWCQVTDALDDAAEVLRPQRKGVAERQVPTPSPAIGIEGPSLDIDF